MRDLAGPDWPLAFIAAGITMVATAQAGAPSPEQRALMLGLSGMVTIVALSKMAAGVALYWAVSSLFGVIQSWLVQRKLTAAAV